MTAVYPLSWPHNRPRIDKPAFARFQTPGRDAIRHLEDQVRRMGGRNLLVTTNLPVGRTGLIRWSDKRPLDQAVAIYFDLDAEEICFACDRWGLVEDNVRAIGKTVEALRGLERWGSQDMVRTAFSGFAALPAPSGQDWWIVLGVEPGAPRSAIESAYRAKLKVHHPDMGGDPEQFHAVQSAFQAATALT